MIRSADPPKYLGRYIARHHVAQVETRDSLHNRGSEASYEQRDGARDFVFYAVFENVIIR
jgi:hypothetical protein